MYANGAKGASTTRQKSRGKRQQLFVSGKQRLVGPTDVDRRRTKTKTGDDPDILPLMQWKKNSDVRPTRKEISSSSGLTKFDSVGFTRIRPRSFVWTVG